MRPPASSELVLMLLADARLPVGGHTQSGGLEPALRDGLRDVPALLSARLASVARVEAGTAVVALNHALAGLPLSAVEDAWAARTPSPAMRDAARTLGRGLARLAGRLWPEVDVPPGAPRAVVAGAVAAAAGVAPLSLARLIGYDDVQTVVTAALKLMPGDPAEAAGWVLARLPEIEALAADVATLTYPSDIPATGSPQIEQWAEAHARTTRRLFSA